MDANAAPQNLRVKWLDITMVLPDGSQMHIGKPDFWDPNPIINLVQGWFEKVRFETNRRKFNAYVERYQQEQAHG